MQIYAQEIDHSSLPYGKVGGEWARGLTHTLVLLSLNVHAQAVLGSMDELLTS